MRLAPIVALVLLACEPGRTVALGKALAPAPGEDHLADLRQLTFEGENAEAYFSSDGRELSLQARGPGQGCDRIYRLPLFEAPLGLLPVSSGKGATTCAHFLPGDRELIYASTHLEGAGCPPRPDMSQGYVWALYKSYDIFRANADGTGLVRLTDTPGYDAEGTVCPRDGSIVFTSVRDGDLELYRMDRDGKNVKRLTQEPGYDGGAFFNRDCSRIVWRASRPRGAQLEEYRRLLAQGLVRPTKLEIWTAHADGSEAQQITYLDAASFAPFFSPDGRRVLFASNFGDPRGREFDIFSIGVDGTRLTRVTRTRGFDGFPIFSPDGALLAFSSNRATAPGKQDTNVFVARWIEEAAPPPERAPDRILRDVAWLAAEEREGRGLGTSGLAAAGEHLERRFAALGLRTERQAFPAPTAVRLSDDSALAVDGAPVSRGSFVAAGFSSSASIEAALIYAGWGIQAHERDDYAKVAVRGRIAVAQRFVPKEPAFEKTDAKRRYGDLRYKAFTAREQGALGLVVVDWSDEDEGKLPPTLPEGDAGIPVVVVRRSALEPFRKRLLAGEAVPASMRIEMLRRHSQAFNVVAHLPAGAAAKLHGTVVIGAHYDHLGQGGRTSLAPDAVATHPGADDNASGVAAVLEAARELSGRRAELRRDVAFVAFTGEETGLLGSAHYMRGARAADIAAMINLDMVGRLRNNRLVVVGADSAAEWPSVVEPACAEARIECKLGGDGYGPSDQTSFYAAGVPVLHLFTGAHDDYHKPSDVPDRLNAAGAAQIAALTAGIALRLPPKVTVKRSEKPAPLGDVRTFGASLGTIPDYAGPPGGQKGVLLAGVRTGGGADKAGLRRGDILVRLGTHDIGSVEDFMFVLRAARPGQSMKAGLLRGGERRELTVTFQGKK